MSKKGIHSLLEIPNKQLIVSSSADSLLRVWSLESGECINTINGIDNVDEK